MKLNARKRVPRSARLMQCRPLVESLEERALLSAALAVASPSSGAAVAGQPGAILREYWNGIAGSNVSDLTTNAVYPNNPSGASLLSAFESPAGNVSNFGQRIRGILSPTTTGAYTFYIAGDASAQLFLSNDTNPANEQMIASVPSATAPEQWMQSPAQQSVSIVLNAGSSYYIEALSKESTGTGDIGVAWSLPNGSFQGPIAGQYLAPVVPTVQIWDTQPIAARGDNVPAIFTVTRTGGSTALPVTVSYALSGTAVNGVDYHTLGGAVTIPAGATSAPINLLGIDDHLSHGNKTVTFTLTAGSAYALAAPADITTGGTLLGSNPAISSGTSLVPSNVTTSLAPVGSSSAKTTTLSVTGLPFTSAIELQSTVSPASGTVFPFAAPTSSSFAKGDVLFLQFYARSMNADGSAIEFTTKVEKTASPNSALTTYTNSAGVYWRKYDVPISAGAGYAAGAARLDFRLNNDTQALEVGGLSLVDLHASATVSSLPTTPMVYDNNYNDAWRAAAQANINQYREGNLTVNVTDGNGNPIPGAVVSVQQVRQSFNFGAALNGHYLVTPHDTEYNRIYRAMAEQLLNTGTDEYNLKWPYWDSQRQEGLDSASWITNAGLTLRGHNLVWPNWQYLPPEVQTQYTAILNDPNQGRAAAAAWLEQTIVSHIQDEVGTLAGEPAEWDTLVEPYSSHAVIDIVGKPAVVDWFKAAHFANPNARLVINDFGIIGTDVSHQNNYSQWIQYLLSNGAPLGGLGEESHFSGLPPTIKQVQSFFNQFGKFNLPIDITEFDVNSGNQQLIADFARDYMTQTFSQPLATDFIAWDFWAGNAFLPTSALVGKNRELTAFGKEWVDLVFGQWATHTQGTTFAAGQYSTRAFTGTLNVTVTLGNQTTTKQVSVTTAGAILNVTLANTASAAPNASAASLPGGVTVSWKPWASNAARYVVQRSDDNVNFAAIASLPANATHYFDVNAWPTLTEYYRVIALDTTGNPISTASTTLTPSTLAPADFFYITGDIGSTPAGSTTFASGTYTLVGGGADIGGTSDHFHCDFDNALGDTTLIAHVASLQSKTATAKAGLMIRTDNTVNSAFVDVVTTPGGGILLQYRSTSAGPTTTVALGNASSLPWLKLVRAGNSFSASASADGMTWTQVGPAITLSMPMAPLAGLVVTSGTAGKTSTGVFDHVSETPGVLRIIAS